MKWWKFKNMQIVRHRISRWITGALLRTPTSTGWPGNWLAAKSPELKPGWIVMMFDDSLLARTGELIQFLAIEVFKSLKSLKLPGAIGHVWQRELRGACSQVTSTEKPYMLLSHEFLVIFFVTYDHSESWRLLRTVSRRLYWRHASCSVFSVFCLIPAV